MKRMTNPKLRTFLLVLMTMGLLGLPAFAQDAQNQTKQRCVCECICEQMADSQQDQNNAASQDNQQQDQNAADQQNQDADGTDMNRTRQTCTCECVFITDSDSGMQNDERTDSAARTDDQARDADQADQVRDADQADGQAAAAAQAAQTDQAAANQAADDRQDAADRPDAANQDAAQSQQPGQTDDQARDAQAADRPAGVADTTPPAVAQSRLVEIPTEPGMREAGDIAWVRVLNLSPNAGSIDFNLEYNTDETVQPTIPDFMQNVEYGNGGNYADVPAGSYTLHLPGQPDVDHDFTVNAGKFYTLVVYGLELPPEAEADARNEGGFMGWLRGLFGGDDGSDAYHLDIQLLEDNLFHNNLENEAIVRVMNAAPGAEDVELAVTGETGTLSGAASYGEVTGTDRLDTSEFTGPLELRLSGSRAATIPLEDVSLNAGTVNTVFLVGTPIEDAPLHGIVLSTPAFADDF